MKKINLSAVSTTNGFPVKSGSIDHLQSAYTETISHTVRQIVGSSYSTSIAYILWGCTATGTDPGARTISEGAIFFNGEVYKVPSASFTTTGLQVAVGTIATTYFSATNADPVAFTDGVNRNVHEIRQIVFSNGLSGSGDFNFADAVVLNDIIRSGDVLKLNNTTAFTPSGDYNPATKKYADETSGMKLLWLGVIAANGTVTKLAGSLTVTATQFASGQFTITHNIGNTNYFISALGFNNSDSTKDFTPVTGYESKGSTSFRIFAGGDRSSHDYIQFELAIFKYF